MIAAIQVFSGHAVEHLNMGHSFWILNLFLGVPIFFSLSGFLIWASIERTPCFKDYLKKRILRIYPELWIGVLLSLTTIVIFYFEHIDWKLMGVFAITQGTFMQFWTPEFLRDFGCGTPNGSLWTICVIIQFYIVAWFLHKALKRKRDWIILIIVSLLVGVFTPQISRCIPNIILRKLFTQTIIPHLWMFLTGAFVWEYKDKILKPLMRFWYIPAILLVILRVLQVPTTGTYDIFRCTLLSLFVFGFGYKFPQFNIKKDISYGIYIYHMIVINVLVELNMIESWAYFIISFILTVFLAITSHYITTNGKKSIFGKHLI